jgi:hypothetical protein
MHFIIPHSFQVFATHTKLVPHSLPSGGAIRTPGFHSTAAVIGPVGGGAIVAPPIIVYSPPQFVEHQLVQYSATNDVPTATPLKLLFTRFPPFIEAIVQRIQNYYSTYNHINSEKYPDSPPKNKPGPPDAANATTLPPVSPTNEMPTTKTETPFTTIETPTTITEEPNTITETPTTIADTPPSNNAEPEAGNWIYGVPNGDDTSTTPPSAEQEDSSGYEISVANPFS